MPKQGYYRKMFFIGAVWNWVATITFIVGYKILFPWFDMELPNYPVFFLMFLGLCFVFGIGYYWVSRDIHKNQGIVMMGILGKLIVFVAMLWAFLIGQIHFIFASAGSVDLIFAILYIEFLMAYKRADQNA
jgi:hypothetical protein